MLPAACVRADSSIIITANSGVDAASSLCEEVDRLQAVVDQLLLATSDVHITPAVIAAYGTKTTRQLYYLSRQQQVGLHFTS